MILEISTSEQIFVFSAAKTRIILKSSSITTSEGSSSLSISSCLTSMLTICEPYSSVGFSCNIVIPLIDINDIPDGLVIPHPILCFPWQIQQLSHMVMTVAILLIIVIITKFTFLFLYFLYNNMNLTINNPSKTAKTQSGLTPATPNSRKSNQSPSTPPPQPQRCIGFLSNCMGGQQRPKEQMHQYLHETKPRLLDVLFTPLPKLQQEDSAERPKRKCKISLSLNHKDTQQHTPSKGQPSNKPRYVSQYKKFKTEHGNSQGYPCVDSKTEAIKLKTEPKKQRRNEEGMHQLKESRKPSTQIGSAHSVKRSSDSSGKVKLTIGNGFRSQMQTSPQFIPLPAPQEPPSSVVIQESFMTARLANIYGQRIATELELFPNSNIVYYNQLMADQKAWRGQGEQRQRQKGEISIQNIPDDDQNERPEEEETNIKSRFKERRWIGEYAKTIKTFNQSELRSNQLNSEAESIVLQKGYSNFYPYGGANIMPINRGSIKQWRQNANTQKNRRQFSSVGEDYGAYSLSHQNRFKKMISPPIVEDLYDSDHNYERE